RACPRRPCRPRGRFERRQQQARLPRRPRPRRQGTGRGGAQGGRGGGVRPSGRTRPRRVARRTAHGATGGRVKRLALTLFVGLVVPPGAARGDGSTFSV